VSRLEGVSASGSAGAQLPPEQPPFPVEAAYRIRSDLRKLSSDTRHFLADTAWPRYLRRKLELLEADPDSCRVLGADEHSVGEGLWQLAALLAAEQPGRFLLEEDRLDVPHLGAAVSRSGELDARPDGELQERVRAQLERVRGVRRLADFLALSVQEDLVLMAGPPGEDLASLLHVCFPSHWNPAERRGASFARLHAPVPHNQRLLASSGNIVSAMLSKGPFERFVWSLTSNPDLDQNPARPHAEGRTSADELESLWFRSERQTTRALRGHGLFTIRVYVTPLTEALDTPQRARLLAQAIRSMDEELLRYKGLEGRRGPLLAALDERATRP
jgi:hypothetical protein